jgi:ABC-type amino acid transport substrate-binding protein
MISGSISGCGSASDPAPVASSELQPQTVHSVDRHNREKKEREVRKLRSVVIALLVTGGLLGIAETSAAQDSPILDRVIQSGKLRVGMSATQPPFTTMLANARRAELEIVNRPFGELLSAMAGGEVDMVMSGMAITPQRAQASAFIGPYMLSGKSILTKSTTLANATGMEDLDKPEVRLAALSNSTSQEFVEDYTSNAQLITVAEYDEAVSMLLAGEIDALVADMPICLLSMLRHPDQGLATLRQPFTVEPIGIAVPANDLKFRNLIDNYLEAIEKTGILEQLRKAWLEDGAWVAALP